MEKNALLVGIDKIDLHMHSVVSDGTDTPELMLEKVTKAGIDMFSLTDHDSIKGCAMIRARLTQDSPHFINGVEFSCRDEDGKYHILGYSYDDRRPAIREKTRMTHEMRMRKVRMRLDFLKSQFGIEFPLEEVKDLLSLDNPGKPHIGNLMVKYGFAPSKDVAIRDYIDKLKLRTDYIRPEEAISAILESGGIPVLAHPSYGSGNELIIGDAMEARIKKLIGFGIQGMEAFYSGFTRKLENEILGLASKYDLYVTAGSDYHGHNKLVILGDNNLDSIHDAPENLRRFVVRALELSRTHYA